MRTLLPVVLAILLLGCAGPATGPVKGVLVVSDGDLDPLEVDALLAEIQLFVPTVTEEPVFDFSSCTLEEFGGDLEHRRTILFIVNDPGALPEDLIPQGGLYTGRDVWATGQYVFGVVLPLRPSAAEISTALEAAYDQHLSDYVYESFVSTQMSSRERMDSLLTLGFSMDIPKSYHLADWDADIGFVQYQRSPSDVCFLILSIRWIDDGKILNGEEAVLWREAVARNFFYQAASDSVDRSSVSIAPLTLRGIEGWRLLGMWRNPEHLNAGAFTSYILHHEGVRYLLDLEVFHEHREKEPYIREGWLVMNSFIPGS